MFPYYIVRFKQKNSVDEKEIIEMFPYYIVRFKPGFAKNAMSKKKSFHTT